MEKFPFPRPEAGNPPPSPHTQTLFLSKRIPSKLKKHLESSKNCIFGQILNNSLIFPIFGPRFEFYCIPHLVIIEVGVAKILLSNCMSIQSYEGNIIEEGRLSPCPWYKKGQANYCRHLSEFLI